MPSAGLANAEYAFLAAPSSPSAMLSAVMSLCCLNDSEKPLSICDKITPLLPRAPNKAP